MSYELPKIDIEAANRELLPLANSLLGTSAQTFDALIDSILPPKILELKRLAVMYEAQMVLGKDAKAYYSACVMGASMVEAILLILCFFNHEKVKRTRRYVERCGSNNEFDKRMLRLGLDDLIEIADELKWVPEDLIDKGWKNALPNEFRAMALERRPNQPKEKAEQLAAWVSSNSALVLMRLLITMRNRVHPGRWVRQNHQLVDDTAFNTWSQVVVVAAAHLRDCLFAELQSAMNAFLLELIQQSISRKLFHGEDLSDLQNRLVEAAERFRQVVLLNPEAAKS